MKGAAMIRKIGIVLVLLLVSQVLHAQQATVNTNAPAPPKENTLSMFVGRFGYFLASKEFKDIYGNGVVFGGELRLGGRRITGWLEGNYRARTGKFSFTKEETKVNVLAIEGGALYKIKIKSGNIMPYVGAGLGYYMYDEKNEPIGEAKKNQIGFCVVGGASMRVFKSLALDCRIKYSTCSMQPADFKINIGGLTFGLGLGLGF
jgi:opacity protein-like surface antigen